MELADSDVSEPPQCIMNRCTAGGPVKIWPDIHSDNNRSVISTKCTLKRQEKEQDGSIDIDN